MNNIDSGSNAVLSLSVLPPFKGILWAGPLVSFVWANAKPQQDYIVKTDKTGYSTSMDGIHHFTGTVAILNLLDLRSSMGCPGGTCSVFTCAFRAKRELQCIFLGKKVIIITSKQGNTIFFFPLQSFLGNLKEKLTRKTHVNTDASISDRAHAPWASLNTR